MRSIFDAVINNDEQAVATFIQQGVSVNERFNAQSNWSRIGANCLWYFKKYIGVTEMTGSIFLFGAGITLGVMGVGAPSLAFWLSGATGSVGATAMWAGDGALAKYTFNQTQWTPLHFAAATNAKNAAEVLINNEADTNLKDTCGRTFLDIARMLNHIQFVQYCEGFIAGRAARLAQVNNASFQLEQKLADMGALLKEERRQKKQLGKQKRAAQRENTGLREQRNDYANLLASALGAEVLADQKDEKRFPSASRTPSTPSFFDGSSTALINNENNSDTDESEDEKVDPNKVVASPINS